MRSALAFLCISIATLAGSAESEPVRAATVEDPIQQLIQDLSSDSYDRREAASQTLLDLGEPVWPFLRGYLHDQDWERQLRVRALGEVIGIFGDDEIAQVRELLTKLEDCEDEMRRAQGVDGLVALGPVGLRLLRKHVASGDAQSQIELDVSQTVWRVGEQVTCEALARNAGPGVYWRRARGLYDRLTLEIARVEEFGASRARFGQRSGGGRRRLIARGGEYRNPIRDWVALPSGALIMETSAALIADRPGIYEVRARFEPATLTAIHPRIPGTTETVALHMQSEARRSAEALRIFALPDMSGLPVDGRLTMALRRKTADGDRKDGRARVDVVLRAGDVEKPVILEKDLPLYAWYAILDASGTPVKWGRWASVWVAEEEPKPAVLSKGAEVVWPLDIKMPAEPGRYSLVVYYEIDDSGLIDMPEFPEEDLPSDQTVPVGERFDNGRLGTVLEGLVVGDGTAAR